jgi:DNA-binding NarL/FixJ family response regulator
VHAALALRRSHPELGVLLFSQYVETRYARELLASTAGGVGYLLKDRVVDVADFVAALERVAAGGTALDPAVVAQLLGSSKDSAGLSELSGRERTVLSLMAQGHTNSAIAKELSVTERAVEKHIASIFTKLELPASDSGNRRVLAVLRYLGA